MSAAISPTKARGDSRSVILVLAEIRREIGAARQRSGDDTIGVRVEQGRYQIVRVTYPANLGGGSLINEVTGYDSLAETIAALKRIAPAVQS